METRGIETNVCCVIVEQKNVKKIKVALESSKFLHKEYRITEIKNYSAGKSMAIPVTFRSCGANTDTESREYFNRIISGISDDVTIQFVDKDVLLKTKVIRPQQRLLDYCCVYLQGVSRLAEDEKDRLLKEIPTKWEVHGDLIMFGDNSFCSNFWDLLEDETFWTGVAEIFGVKRVTLMSRIINDGFRTPSVRLKLGAEGGWVEHVDNGITYTYDVTTNMFSKGNITEKLRIAKMNCHGEVVVDMFAGIGYFVLPYLIKAKAKMVYACEWNPDAVYALKKNLQLNNVSADRYRILHGDNRMVAPKNIADRVNLGLVPTSSESWLAASQALKIATGGWLHIHENIDSGPNAEGMCSCVSKDVCIIRSTHKERLRDKKAAVWCLFVARTIQTLQKYFTTTSFWCIQLKHVEHVKSYAPHVDHVVLDILCRPSR